MRGFAVSTMLLLSVLAWGQDNQSWKYNERISEMDDSVWSYVITFTRDQQWGTLMHCEASTVLRIWGVNDLTKTDAKVMLRFDKGKATTHQVAYIEDPRGFAVGASDMLDLFLENAILRVSIPPEVTESYSYTILRFDLLDFNQAWQQCEQ